MLRIRFALATVIVLLSGSTAARAQPAPPPAPGQTTPPRVELPGAPRPAAATTPAQAQSTPDAGSPPLVGTADPTRFVNLLKPFRTDVAALSPDGKLLAYSIRENETLSVVVVDIDHPEKVKLRTTVATDDTSTPIMQANVAEKTPAQIRFLGWATPTRLIVETNTNVATAGANGGEWKNTSGVIAAIDADGGNPRTLVTPKDIAEVSDIPLTTPTPTPSEGAIARPDEEPAADPAAADSDSLTTGLDSNLPADVVKTRSPRFLDYAPGEPDWIIVRSSDVNNYGLFKVNIHTGKLRYVSKEIVTPDLRPLVDRQGKPRVAVPATTLTSFPHRFVLEKTAVISLGRWNDLDKIAAAAGNTAFSLSPENYLGQRSFPVGFDEDPNILYYASNVGRDTYGLYGLDLKTGQRTGKPIESPTLDMIDASPNGFPDQNPLVFDRFDRKLTGLRYQARLRSAVWLRPEWQEAQAQLEANLANLYPGSSVEIQDWDQTGRRFLALVRSPADSGGYYVYDRETKKLSEFVRRAPWITPAETPVAMNLSLDNPAGGKLTATLFIPRAVRQKPIPLIVVCQSEPWLRTRSEFQNDISAFAQMGFAVLQLNPRGVWGFGLKHRDTVKNGYEQVQVDDIVAAIDTLSKAMPLNAKRVALYGEKRGAYLALRALQLRPDRFRCVIALEPTVNLRSWLAEARWTSSAVAPNLIRSYFGDAKSVGTPLVDHPEKVTKPIFLLSYRGPDGAPTELSHLNTRRFGEAVARNKDVAVEYHDLSQDYMRGHFNARADVLRHMEDFINTHLYAFNVKLGPDEVVK